MYTFEEIISFISVCCG